jgi:site-specific DNA-methyltransferase (adenine-specific)
MAGTGRIVQGDNLEVLRGLDDGVADLVYLDPPFNTGKAQTRVRVKSRRDPEGARVGFSGQRYTDEVLGSATFRDAFDDYLGFLGPRLEELRRVLTPTGSLFVHLDANEVHYVKVFLDGLFGRDCFQNEIVWAYDYGARSKKRWSAKHDTILWYTRDPKRYHFDFEAMDRIPYMAPRLQSAEKLARGKTPTDVWWHTIVAPQGKERTGYPTQKPLGVLERIVKVHSRPGDLVLDPFAGSGTTGEAAAKHGREFLLIDDADEAIRVMRERLAAYLGTTSAL